jgi:hypothetical protein
MKKPFLWYQDFWSSDLRFKNLYPRLYLLNQELYGFDTWDVDALCRDLSFGTKTFDFLTLILNFDLVLKNWNLDYIRYRVLIFEI